MLRLELVFNSKNEAVYDYFPEGKQESGTVSINKDTGEFAVKKIAVNDNHKRYLSHAISRIEKYFKEKNFREKDTVAWC